MVFCTYCGQSFTRDEHLERHILTHTNVKPFKCFTCHMSFARRDLLQRHYTVHGRDQNNQEGLPPSNGIIPKSAGRTPIACTNCAKTKTKCDKKFPCSRCASRSLKCTLRPTRRTPKNTNGLSNTEERSINEGRLCEDAGAQHSAEDEVLDAETVDFQAELEDEHVEDVEDSPPEEPEGMGEAIIRFDQSNFTSRGNDGPTILSPLPSPGDFLIQQTKYPPVEITALPFTNESDSTGLEMDWTNVTLPDNFDFISIPEKVAMDPLLNVDVTEFRNLVSTNGYATTVFPEYDQVLTASTVPITPNLEEFHLADFNKPCTGIQSPSIEPTLSNSSGNSDLSAIISAQNAWSVFQCNSIVPSRSCPRTARLNLEQLEICLKDHDSWNIRPPRSIEDDYSTEENLPVSPLLESTRDKILAITQTFLHKALEIHKESSVTDSPGKYPTSPTLVSNFLLLPPADILMCTLRIYANNFERFFPLTPKGVLDVNEIFQNSNDKAASLLMLLMIAQGAMALPSVSGRFLTGGLTEACRISLFDLVEKNIIMAGNNTVQHSALLFTVQAAWSGDKWQMDIAMGQRGMYIAMLRHSGFLEPYCTPLFQNQPHVSVESVWKDWVADESKSRLTYSWALVDQELSLFHDTAPLFSVTEFGAPMPDSECLWKAKTSAEWSDIYGKVHEFSSGVSSVGSGVRPPSLRDLFRQFLDDEVFTLEMKLTPFQLRLLLHPLQTLVNQYCQLLGCVTTRSSPRSSARSATAPSTQSRLEEINGLLQRWYSLASRYLKTHPACSMMQASLVIFHLISLNTAVKFPDIERLARHNQFDQRYVQSFELHKRCMLDEEAAVFHCGQIIRLIRTMCCSARPPWWPGAIYRAALVLCSKSMASTGADSTDTETSPRQTNTVIVDSLPAEHPILVRYLNERTGTPSLKKCDGTLVAIDSPASVISHCIGVIDEGVSTRFSDGIRNKIGELI